MVQRSSNVTRIVDKLEVKNWLSEPLVTMIRRKMDIRNTNKEFELLEKLDKKIEIGINQ